MEAKLLNIHHHNIEYLKYLVIDTWYQYQFEATCIVFSAFILAILFIATRKRVSLKKAISMKYISSLSWEEFEELIAKFYKAKGYSVKLKGGSGGDNGIDVLLFKKSQKTIVQCKHWKTKSVGVPIIREMFGVMVSEKAISVIIVTSGRFTKEAYNFAKGKPIELVNGVKLNQYIKEII